MNERIMYLDNDDSHCYVDDDGRRHHTRGAFLLLLEPKRMRLDGVNAETVRACVREVALSQRGNWMMGQALLGPDTLVTVSGTFGNNGLPMRVSYDVFLEYGVPVPTGIYSNRGETEGNLKRLRDWARKNLDALTLSDPLTTNP